MQTPYKSDGGSRRYRGILTSDDVENLRDGWGDGPQDSRDRDRRYRIRKRTEQAIYDLEFLFQRLPGEDIRQIFDNVTQSERDPLSQSMAFVYLGILLQYGQDSSDPDVTSSMERLIQSGVNQGSLRAGVLAETSVDIETQTQEADFDELREKILSDGGTVTEIQYLSQHDEDEELLNQVIDRGVILEIYDPNRDHLVLEMTPRRAEEILGEV